MVEMVKKREWFAVVRWSVEDVQERKPSWSNETCQGWLKEHEGAIQEAMVSAGWDAIDALL